MTPTLATLKTLKLPDMAAAFEEQLIQPVTQLLSFNDRFGFVDVLYDSTFHAYKMPRCDRFMGRWLKHGEGLVPKNQKGIC